LPIVLFLVMRRPPRATPFPYTTLFRSSPLALRTFPGQPSEYAGKRGAGTGAGQACWSTAAQRMAEPSDLSPTIVETLYYEALTRSEEHTSELQSRENLVCRLLLENKKK